MIILLQYFENKKKCYAWNKCILKKLCVKTYTWGTLARKSNIPVEEIINEGLEHADLHTTQIYLQGFDHEVIDAANQRVTGL